MGYFLHETSIVDDSAVIGENTKIWHFTHIQSGARIGKGCSLGQNVNISNHVVIGDYVKIQNNVSVYEGVQLEDYVFCGPSCVFTNDLTPRSRYPKNHKYKKTLVRHDAALGANCTIVCGHEIGAYATIAAGAVVTKDVPAHALMAGVPARQVGWVCKCGQVLEKDLCCVDCGRVYQLDGGRLIIKGEKRMDKRQNLIAFRDLKRQYEKLRLHIDQQIAEVISTAHFISGEQVKVLERQLAAYVGAKHCITCANGTDAITIALLAYGIGRGDAVFVPDFTFFSSGECPAAIGATPVFVDVLPTTYNIDPVSLEKVVEKVLSEGGLKPRAVIAVDLFGQAYDYAAVHKVCEKFGMLLLEDAAQGFGGSYTLTTGEKKMNGSLGDIATTSFFPAKPFGCYGDGGAIFTDDDEAAKLCRSIAVHGKDMDDPDDINAKYHNIRLGMNSRLDTLQAAVLLAKFPFFRDEELDAVQRAAKQYSERLGGIEGITTPVVGKRCRSSWAQYTIQLPYGCDRRMVQKKLKEQGIPTNIYYRRPMHKQGAFQNTRSAKADCPVTEYLCRHVLCLPMHPYLREEEIEKVCDVLQDVIFMKNKF